MAKITLKGNPIHTSGELPALGSKAPDFLLTKNDLSDIRLSDFAGKNIVLNIFPSIDTPVCQASVREFHKRAASQENTVILCVSCDLPFAFSRFCGAEQIESVVTASTFRGRDFGKNYGVEIVDGPLAGLCSRAIVLIQADGKVAYTEQVPEIAQEPNYEAVLKAIG